MISMNVVNKKRIRELIDWYDNEIRGEEYFYLERDFFMPIMEALGEDVDEILAYLDEMDVDDLDTISGCFEDIYGKFMTEEVWDALEKLEDKINEQSTRMKEYRGRETKD